MTQASRIEIQVPAGSIPLNDDDLLNVAGGRGWGGGGVKLIFRAIDTIGGLFKKADKTVGRIERAVERTDQKIGAVHDLVSDRANSQTA